MVHGTGADPGGGRSGGQPPLGGQQVTILKNSNFKKYNFGGKEEFPASLY
jgi:hypothetical protein